MENEDAELRIIEKAIGRPEGVKLAFATKAERDRYRIRL